MIIEFQISGQVICHWGLCFDPQSSAGHEMRIDRSYIFYNLGIIFGSNGEYVKARGKRRQGIDGVFTMLHHFLL